MSLSSFLISYNTSIKVLAEQTFLVGTESTFGHTLTIISISIARSAVHKIFLLSVETNLVMTFSKPVTILNSFQCYFSSNYIDQQYFRYFFSVVR